MNGVTLGSIPKIIHQTWKDQQIPAAYQAFHASVKSHHPGWQHRLWTDTDNRDFIAREFDWFLPTFDGYKHHIERVDAVRYFILLHYGGVYLDLDMECLKPLDPLFSKPDVPYFGLLALPTIDNVIVGNAFMASPAGHPFFVYLTRRLPNLCTRDITHSDVFNNTGPDMLARELAAFSKLASHEIIGLDKVCDFGVLDQNPVVAAKNLDTIRQQSLLFLIHHHSNSWNIQHPAPTPAPPGYMLFLGWDMVGRDIDYVEYEPGDYGAIAAACDANDDAIAFNYNGFIKRGGGRLERQSPNGNWIKEGIQPWICAKSDRLTEIIGAEDPLRDQASENSPWSE